MTAPPAQPPADSGPWAGRRVLVAGIARSGVAAATALAARGARVVAVDGAEDGCRRERADALERLGVAVRLGPDAVVWDALPTDLSLVVTSPGWRPDHPLLRSAARAGVPVWGEVELAWRLRPADGPAPWLCVTGTNGKTTTVQMLESILRAGGRRAVATGNIGLPLVDAVLADLPWDVLAVELSSYQLHWSRTLAPLASAVLNVAPDHLDWHGGLDAYGAAKGRIFDRVHGACVYNVADPRTEALVRDADVPAGTPAVGFTLGAPAPGQLGVVDGLLVDRAFGPDAERTAVELAAVADVAAVGGAIAPPAAHNVENALAAAALARAYDVRPDAVRAGLRAARVGAHRIATVGVVDGVTYVDDSKATNPHAAAASLQAFDGVVWVAGGLAKGATFDEVVRATGDRLRAAVLLGRDRGLVHDALRRHAPDVPVIDIAAVDTGAMDHVVRAAAAAARPGDTVLLAPACASMDMFADYAERGDAFAAAVGRLASAEQA